MTTKATMKMLMIGAVGDIYDDTLTAQEMNELYAAQSEDDESDQNDI